MRLLNRYIPLSLAGASLLLSMGTLCLWIRSYWQWDQVIWTRAVSCVLVSSGGLCEFCWGFGEPDQSRWCLYSAADAKEMDDTHWGGAWLWKLAPCSDGVKLRVGAFSLLVFPRGILNDNGGALFLTLPHWFVSVVCVIPPTIILYRHRCKRKRQSRSLCASCGYDLRGNISGICPECGKATVTVYRPGASRRIDE